MTLNEHANISQNAIWVSSYPKSGNTWMMLSLQAAMLKGWLEDINSTEEKGPIASDIRNFEEAIDLDPSDLTQDELLRWRPEILEQLAGRLLQPLFFKMHDHAQLPNGRWLIPFDHTRGVIHLVRDPRDIVISWAHHSNLSLDQSIDFLCDDTAFLGFTPTSGGTQLPQFIGNWSENCLSWMNISKHVPVLQLRYEDRLKAPKETLQQALQFIGMNKSDIVIERIVEKTSFANLQAQESKTAFSAKPPEMDKFFRLGTQGQWQNILSEKQVARIEMKHQSIMKKLGYL